MPVQSFEIDLDNATYQAAMTQAQQAGQTLDEVLTGLLALYGRGEAGVPTTYTVQSGDNLAKIARKVYSDPYKYPVIQNANNLSDPGRIWVGQVLIIPFIAGTTPAPVDPPVVDPAPPPQPEPEPEPIPEPAPPAPVDPTPVPDPSPAQPTIADYVRALPNGFRPDRAGNLQAVYQFQIVDAGIWTVAVANQTATVTDGQTATPSTVIGLSQNDFLSLAEGQLDARQAYQQGRLQVRGDLNLAILVPEIFGPWAGSVVPSTPTDPTPIPDPPAPDPTPIEPPPPPTPDPVPEPEPTPTTPTIADYVQAMATGFRANQAGGVQANYQFRLGSGVWTVAVANQAVTITEGDAGNASVMIGMNDDDYIALSLGQLNTVDAYRQRKILINGDLGLAQRIPDLFGTWGTIVGTSPEPPTPTPDPTPPTTTPDPTPNPNPSTPDNVYPQLTNTDFSDYQPYHKSGKQAFWVDEQFPESFINHWTIGHKEEDEGRLHLMDSGTFGRFTQRYFGGGGLNYSPHSGQYSQVISSRYEFDIVFYQTVAAQPGRAYTFTASIVSFYKGTSGERADGKVFKQLGIDPTGGQDYRSSNIVWGDRDGKDNEWRYPSIRATAQGSAITLFIRFENIEKDVGKTELNTIHLDDCRLE
ncbi:MAG: SCP2 sterol-binding domain-containing protein [Chloroflexota bacterium]